MQNAMTTMYGMHRRRVAVRQYMMDRWMPMQQMMMDHMMQHQAWMMGQPQPAAPPR